MFDADSKFLENHFDRLETGINADSDDTIFAPMFLSFVLLEIVNFDAVIEVSVFEFLELFFKLLLKADSENSRSRIRFPADADSF